MKLLFLLFVSLSVTCATAQITIRVSVKRILGTNGELPGVGGYPTSMADIQQDVVDSNKVLADAGRGYRLQLVEIVDLAGVWQWFSVPMSQKGLLEQAAEAAPATYRWKSDAINVYINNSGGGGICSFPGTDDIILWGPAAGNLIFVHEIGHYFNLVHPFEGGSCCNPVVDPFCTNGCDRATDPNCVYIFGDDGLPDTIHDVTCGTADDLAQKAFGANYAALNPEQQRVVDLTFYNVMGYHLPFANNTNLTTLQLDRWTDAANGPRRAVCSGRTWFVDGSCGTSAPNGNSTCESSAGPYPSLAGALGASSAGDIVLIRSGVYNEPQTIFKPITLRATRGDAIIRRQ